MKQSRNKREGCFAERFRMSGCYHTCRKVRKALQRRLKKTGNIVDARRPTFY